jgi:hypothetical protein
VGYLDSVNKAGLGAAAANASVTQSGASVTVAVHVAHGVDIPGALSVFADQTNVTSDATGQTVQLVFNGGLSAVGFGPGGANTLWFGGNGGAAFSGGGGSDILVAGAGNDVVHGGAGWDSSTAARALTRCSARTAMTSCAAARATTLCRAALATTATSSTAATARTRCMTITGRWSLLPAAVVVSVAA